MHWTNPNERVGAFVMNAPEFIVVTGLSGAGKTLASRFLEDMGYFCVDNLPPQLVPTLAELVAKASPPIERVALVIDVRGGEFFKDLFEALDKLHQQGVKCRILFLDADDETLVKRYKETRRRHPLSGEERDLLQAIRLERQRLESLRARADIVLDTSRYSPWELREQLVSFLTTEGQLLIKVMSFGFKYGMPTDADLVFDVRFLPNPNYVPTLRERTGKDADVKHFIFDSDVSREYMMHLREFVEFCLPHYMREGKSYLVIAIGCTGGRHRSVAVADELANWLKVNGYECFIQHRELQREEVALKTI